LSQHGLEERYGSIHSTVARPLKQPSMRRLMIGKPFDWCKVVDFLVHDERDWTQSSSSECGPGGRGSTNEVAAYSTHSCTFSACDPAGPARTTTNNILNHTSLSCSLTRKAVREVYPPVEAALKSGKRSDKPCVVGKFKPICPTRCD
jgi:hypothetical protein